MMDLNILIVLTKNKSNIMWTIINEIENAVENINLPKSELRICNTEEAKQIFDMAKKTFVKGNPRVWWLSLNVHYDSFYYENSDGYKDLIKFIPDESEQFWLIPETETNSILVLETNLFSVTKLIEECTGFEYNLVSKNFNWLIIENDHNEIFLAKA